MSIGKTVGLINALAGGGGSSGGVLVVNEDENGTLDKTWQEIHDAMLSGGAVVKDDTYHVVAIVCNVDYQSMSNEYGVFVATTDNWAHNPYVTSSASGYPVFD